MQTLVQGRHHATTQIYVKLHQIKLPYVTENLLCSYQLSNNVLMIKVLNESRVVRLLFYIFTQGFYLVEVAQIFGSNLDSILETEGNFF